MKHNWLVYAGVFMLGAAAQAKEPNILGRTTPFSQTQACKQLNCRLHAQAKAGPYMLYTYAVKGEQPAMAGLFSLKKNERNVAVGYYLLPDNGRTNIPGEWAGRLTKAFGYPLPKAMNSYLDDSQALSGKKTFSLPLEGGVVLSDKTAGDSMNAKQDENIMPFVYLARSQDAAEVAAFLNRRDDEAKGRIITELKNLVGVTGTCKPAKGKPDSYRANGKPVKTNQRIKTLIQGWEKQADKRLLFLGSGGGEDTFYSVAPFARNTVGISYNFSYPEGQKDDSGLCFW